MSNKRLALEDGTYINWFAKEPTRYFNRTTLLFGRTDSGKTTIIDEIMKMVEKQIAVVFVICQSSVTVESSDYYGKVPSFAIKNNVSTEWLEEFMDRQKGIATLYRVANNIKTLQDVFNYIKTTESSDLENICIRKAQKYIDSINQNNSLDFAQKKGKITSINTTKEKYLKNLYKKYIRENKVYLERKPGLSQNEKCCINYLDLNPNAMIIYDDCASLFKKWCRDSPTIKEVFYNGRHSYITQVISTQDDKEIDSALRKNALVSIFTTSQAATSNFGRASNGYTKAEKKRAEICSKRIFSEADSKGAKNYKKLVYSQKDSDPFMYMIADLYDNIKVGCDAVWDMDKKITEATANSNSNNSFFNTFHSI
jgi:hypothetical protein